MVDSMLLFCCCTRSIYLLQNAVNITSFYGLIRWCIDFMGPSDNNLPLFRLSKLERKIVDVIEID